MNENTQKNTNSKNTAGPDIYKKIIETQKKYKDLIHRSKETRKQRQDRYVRGKAEQIYPQLKTFLIEQHNEPQTLRAVSRALRFENVALLSSALKILTKDELLNVTKKKTKNGSKNYYQLPETIKNSFYENLTETLDETISDNIEDTTRQTWQIHQIKDAEIKPEPHLITEPEELPHPDEILILELMKESQDIHFIKNQYIIRCKDENNFIDILNICSNHDLNITLNANSERSLFTITATGGQL